MPGVLDSSAIVALINREPGHEKVAAILISGASMCTANLAEVMTVLLRSGVPELQARRILDRLPVADVDLDRDLALAAAVLSPLTSSLGLSLGDRICLALAKQLREPAITADKIWAEAAPLVDTAVTLIR